MINIRKPRELSPDELNIWVAENKDFCLIDILPNDHFMRIHLPNSKNACVFEVDFIEQIKRIVQNKETQIVLYGSSDKSMDAIIAAEKLKTEGFRYISVLQGGVKKWKAHGFSLSGDAVDEEPDPQVELKIEDGIYTVSTDKSSIQWTGRNQFSTHFGNIQISEGELTVNKGNITGSFDIDMNSITNINLEGDEMQSVLIDHLKSDDFFFTRLFPYARFKIESSLKVQKPSLTAPNYEITGDLELRGVKADINFMATITKSAENGLAAEAHFDIDRTKWNIIYGSTRFFEYLGMHQVFDLISIQLRIVTI